jgi:hypothetical protein
MDSYKSQLSIKGRPCTLWTHPEVGRDILELLEWYRYTLDVCVPLLFEAENGFKEQYSVVVLGMHLHKAFHEVLRWHKR